MSYFYDKRGIPVMPGDTLKVFHYVAALRREKRYMYKFVKEVDSRGLLVVSHLSLQAGHYFLAQDGEIHPYYEIVQGYGGVPSGNSFRDRERKKTE